jgi:hypothetical protein
MAEGKEVNLLNILEGYTKGLAALNGTIKLLRSAKDQLPNEEQKVLIEKKIAEAEHSLQLGNAEIGQSLGFQLCQCTWPHQVMVSLGYSEENQREQFKCRNCGKIRSVERHAMPSETIIAFDPYDVY